MMGVLCWPVGWLAKHHTKRCLELQNNMVGHTTFVGAPDMSAGLVFTATHMPICPAFHNSSQSSPLYFTSLECSFIISWNTCSLLVTNICPFIALFFFLCLLLLVLIIIYLFIVLPIFVVYVGCLSNGICCGIFVESAEYTHQLNYFCVRVFIQLVL